MGAWDYLKYLAGIKPTVRKPLDFTPTTDADMARLTDPTQDPKVGPRPSYDPMWEPMEDRGIPISGRVPTWSDMRPMPVRGVPGYEDEVLGGDPASWHADAANMAISPEEVEFLTRSQEKRDAAVREATLPVPKSWFNQNIAPLGRRLAPGLGGAAAGAMVLGPVGALVGGAIGGFSGSEAAQDEEELARQRAESDLPQAYGTPAYKALLQQIQQGRQERNLSASVIEGGLNALPMGTLRSAGYLSRIAKEGARGAAIGAGSTALLKPFDTSGQVSPGG
jgi:hypothetical protein